MTVNQAIKVQWTEQNIDDVNGVHDFIFFFCCCT